MSDISATTAVIAVILSLMVNLNIFQHAHVASMLAELQWPTVNNEDGRCKINFHLNVTNNRQFLCLLYFCGVILGIVLYSEKKPTENMSSVLENVLFCLFCLLKRHYKLS